MLYSPVIFVPAAVASTATPEADCLYGFGQGLAIFSCFHESMYEPPLGFDI